MLFPMLNVLCLYISGITKLVERCTKCIEKQGDCRQMTRCTFMWLSSCVSFSMLLLFIDWLTFVLPAVRVQCPIWLLSVVAWCRALTVCCWRILWVVLRRFFLPAIITVSLLFLRSTRAVFMLQGLYSLQSFPLISWSHFCLLILQHVLTHMFLFHYHTLRCPVYCYGRFCPFALVNSVIQLRYLRDLFLPISVQLTPMFNV